MKHTRAFTLVELIVVITILAILGTIGFISLQGYSVNARDSVRIADTKTFIKALNIYQTKEGQVPLPDDLTTITGSGTIFSYQGTLGKSVITALGQGAVPLDPTLKTPYLYATNEGQTKFQLLSYHEKNNAAVPLTLQGYADYTDMFPKVTGDPIGIVINEDNSPVVSGSLNLASETGNYKYIVTDERIISGSGGQIALNNPRSSCMRLLESSSALNSGVYSMYPTGESAYDFYCDMETDGGGWTLVSNVLSVGAFYLEEGNYSDFHGYDAEFSFAQEFFKKNPKDILFQNMKECVTCGFGDLIKVTRVESNWLWDVGQYSLNLRGQNGYYSNDKGDTWIDLGVLTYATHQGFDNATFSFTKSNAKSGYTGKLEDRVILGPTGTPWFSFWGNYNSQIQNNWGRQVGSGRVWMR